jgi:hypothetical protein
VQAAPLESDIRCVRGPRSPAFAERIILNVRHAQL